MSVYLLSQDIVFPPAGLASDSGLLAVGGDLSHLRLVVHEPNQPTISGIAFGYGTMAQEVKEKGRCDLAYVIDENHWQGQTSLQLMVKDVKV